MKTHRTLIISSFVASLVTLAAAPAMAQTTHLDYAADLVENMRPDVNEWGSPCNIDFDNYTATSNGACLFTLSLRRADPSITSTLVKAWWGSGNPSSSQFYNAIAGGSHFEEVIDINEIQPGDLIAVSWNGGLSGHSMIVEDPPWQITTPFAPIFEGTTQWIVGIIDSATSAHGSSDTRYKAENGVDDDEGVGRGVMRLYTDENESIYGYAWSDAINGTFYPQTTRQLIVGRFVR